MERNVPFHENKHGIEYLNLGDFESQFTPFADKVTERIKKAKILEELIDRANRTFGKINHSQDELDSDADYLGSGSVKIAMRITDRDNNEFALKVLKDNVDIPTSLENEVAPLLKGSGIPHLEQLVAVDRETNTFVTTLAPGKKVTDLSPLEIARIKKSHLREMDQTLRIMHENGLHPHNAGGVLYDKDEGFTFVDYTFDNPDSLEANNRGSNESIEDLLDYLLADLKKFDELMWHEQNGLNVPSSAYATTGRRALARAIVRRRARKSMDRSLDKES